MWSKKPKTKTNFFLKNQNLLNSKPTIGLTHKTTRGIRSSSRWCSTSAAFVVMAYFTKFGMMSMFIEQPTWHLWAIIWKLVRLVYGTHWGDSLHIFITSTFPVLTTPGVLQSPLRPCLQVVCVWGQLAIHHWACLEEIHIDF